MQLRVKFSMLKRRHGHVSLNASHEDHLHSPDDKSLCCITSLHCAKHDVQMAPCFGFSQATKFDHIKMSPESSAHKPLNPCDHEAHHQHIRCPKCEKSRTDLYCRQSLQVSTPVSSSTTNPSMAATTAGTPMLSPRIQSTTAKSMVPVMMASSRDSDPICSSLAAACRGASGVSLISGSTSYAPAVG